VNYFSPRAVEADEQKILAGLNPAPPTIIKEK